MKRVLWVAFSAAIAVSAALVIRGLQQPIPRQLILRRAIRSVAPEIRPDELRKTWLSNEVIQEIHFPDPRSQAISVVVCGESIQTVLGLERVTLEIREADYQSVTPEMALRCGNVVVRLRNGDIWVISANSSDADVLVRRGYDFFGRYNPQDLRSAILDRMQGKGKAKGSDPQM